MSKGTSKEMQTVIGPLSVLFSLGGMGKAGLHPPLRGKHACRSSRNEDMTPFDIAFHIILLQVHTVHDLSTVSREVLYTQYILCPLLAWWRIYYEGKGCFPRVTIDTNVETVQIRF